MYNASKESFLSLVVTEADSALQPLKVLDLLIGGLGLDSKSGIWLNPLNGSLTIPRLFPFDLLYLSKDLHVIQAVEIFPGGVFPPVGGDTASALVLPLHAVSSSQTIVGDSLLISQKEDLEHRSTIVDVPLVALSEPQIEGDEVTSPVLKSLSAASEPRPLAIAVKPDTPTTALSPTLPPRISIESSNSRNALHSESPLELFPGSGTYISTPVVLAAPAPEVATKPLHNQGMYERTPRIETAETEAVTIALPDAMPTAIEPILETAKPGALPAGPPPRSRFPASLPAQSVSEKPVSQDVQFTMVQYPIWRLSEPVDGKSVQKKLGPAGENASSLQTTELKPAASMGASQDLKVAEVQASEVDTKALTGSAASVEPLEQPVLSSPAPPDLFGSRLVEPMSIVLPVSPIPAVTMPLSSLVPAPPTTIEAAALDRGATLASGSPTVELGKIEIKSPSTQAETIIAEPVISSSSAGFKQMTAALPVEQQAAPAAAPTDRALSGEPAISTADPAFQPQICILESAATESGITQFASTAHTKDDLPATTQSVPAIAASSANKEEFEPEAKFPIPINSKARRNRAVAQPNDPEAPHFFTPTRRQFFNPALDTEAPTVGEGALGGPSSTAAQTVSANLPPDLRAAIQKLDEQQSEKQKGKDRGSRSEKEKAKVRTKVAKADAEKLKQKVVRVPVEEEPKTKLADASEAKLSLRSRIARWVDPTVLAANLHSPKRRGASRKQRPGLVAYYWSGGPPQPHEIANISESGFYLFTKDRWIPETVLRMVIQRPDIEEGDPRHAIVVVARVVREDMDGVAYEFVLPENLNRETRDILPAKLTDRKALEHFL